METKQTDRPDERTWRDYVVAWRLINEGWRHGPIEDVFDNGVDAAIERVRGFRESGQMSEREADELLAVLSRPVQDGERAEPRPVEDWEREEPGS